jgi:WD40 repeat protein
MGWPLSQDYNEAIQNPLTTLSDPDLKKGEVAVGPMGLPLPRSGNFADVYQMMGGGRKWAVKCFTRHVPGLQERYAKIDEHLRRVQLPFNVGFRFHEQGIRIRSEWFSIVKMEWVEGFTLNEFVRQHADRPAYLHALLGLWVRLCKRLREAKVAHADLQHGNVLLVPGSGANKLGLKLIDYDGMWVPALAKQPSGEAGHPAYQHPARLRDQVYSADVDRFPHLVIACALRATAVGGSKLWNQFDNGDNLLFRESDFAHPEESQLAKTLWSLDDPTVTNLLSLLVLSTQHPLPKTPWLDEVLVGDQNGLLSNKVLARAAELIGVSRRTLRQAAPAAAVLVEDETNEFANIYEEGQAPQVVNIPKQKSSSKLPWILGGGGVVAASILGAILLLKKPKASNTPTANPDESLVQENSSNPNKPLPVAHSWKSVDYGKPVAQSHTLGDWAEANPPKSRILQSILQPNGYSLGVWFGPDENHAILANKTHLTVYDLKSKSSGQILAKDAGVLSKVAVSPDRKKAITAGEDHVVRVWNLKDGTERWKHELPENVDDLAISPDGKSIVAVGGVLGYIEWSLEEGTFRRSHPDFKARQIVWPPNSDQIIALTDKQIKIWNLKEETATVLAEKTDQKSIAMSQDGSNLFAYGVSGKIDRWELSAGTSLKTFQFLPDKNPLVVASQGDQYLFGYADGTAQLLHYYQKDVSNYGRFARAQTEVTAVALSSDGRYGLVGRSNGMVDLISTTKLGMQPNPIAKKTNPKKEMDLPIKDLDTRMLITGVDLNPNGREFLVHSRQKVVVYDLKTQEPLAEQSSGKQVQLARYIDADRILLSQGQTDTSQTTVWNWKTKSSNELPIPASDQVKRLIRVPGHPWFLYYSDAMATWILLDHELRRAHSRWPSTLDASIAIKNVAVSPDGKSIAYDRGVKGVSLWDCETGAELRAFDQSQNISDFVVSPNGQRLLGRTTDKRVKLWDLKTGLLDKTLEFGGKGPAGPLFVLNDRLLATPTNNILTDLFDTVKEGKASISDKELLVNNRTAYLSSQGLLLNAHDDSKIDVVKFDPAPLESQIVPTPKIVNRDIVKAVDMAGTPTALDYTSDGKGILVGTAQGKLIRFSPDKLTIEKEVEADSSEILRLAAAPRNRVVTLTKDWIRIWDAITLAKLREYSISGVVDSNSCFAVNPGTGAVLLMTDKLRQYEVNEQKQYVLNPPPRIEKGSPLTQFAYSTDGRFGLARWNDSEVGFWKPLTTQETRILDTRAMQRNIPVNPQAAAVSPDGKFVAWGLKLSNAVTLWDSVTGRRLQFDNTTHQSSASGEQGILETLFFLNSTHLLTSGVGKQIILWEVTNWKVVKEFEVPEGAKQMTISPDQQTFVLTLPGKIQIWKLPELPKRR